MSDKLKQDIRLWYKLTMLYICSWLNTKATVFRPKYTTTRETLSVLSWMTTYADLWLEPRYTDGRTVSNDHRFMYSLDTAYMLELSDIVNTLTGLGIEKDDIADALCKMITIQGIGIYNNVNKTILSIYKLRKDGKHKRANLIAPASSFSAKVQPRKR